MTTIPQQANATDPKEVFPHIDAASNVRQVEQVLDAIHDQDIDSTDHDDIHEAADSLVDIYNADCYRWLMEDDNAEEYIEEGLSEFGFNEDRGFVNILQVGQLLQYRAIFCEVIEYLEENRPAISLTCYYEDDGETADLEWVAIEAGVDFDDVEVEEMGAGGLIEVTGLDDDDIDELTDPDLEATDNDGRRIVVLRREG